MYKKGLVILLLCSAVSSYAMGKFVTFKNGTKVSQDKLENLMVKITMLNNMYLAEGCEFVQKCLNPDYEYKNPDVPKILKKFNLDPSDTITRGVVSAAANGEKF